MANLSVKRNPIRIDGTGPVNPGWQGKVIGINSIPSAGSWVTDIYESGASFGRRVYYAKHAAADSKLDIVDIDIGTDGLYAVTLTNITEVDVYFK
jgi:hypothetical protein